LTVENTFHQTVLTVAVIIALEKKSNKMLQKTANACGCE